MVALDSWWELAQAGESLTVKVNIETGSGDFGILVGPERGQWTVNRGFSSGVQYVHLPPVSEAGLWFIQLSRYGGTGTLAASVYAGTGGASLAPVSLSQRPVMLPAGRTMARAALAPVAPLEPSYFGARKIEHPYWTTKLAPDAAVAPTSTDFVNRITAIFNAVPGSSPLEGYYRKASNTVLSTGAYSIPVYELPLDSPRVRIWSKADKYYTDPATNKRVNLRDQLQAVPIPDVTKLTSTIQPSGTDGSVIFICGYEAWECWGFEPATATTPDGYDWQCKQGGYIADTRYHPGWWSGSGDGNNPRGGDFGVSAAGLSYLAVMLTGHDWNSPEIDHPLTVALPLVGGAPGEPDRIRPATRNDRASNLKTASPTVDAYRIPEGARFRLPNNADWTDAKIQQYAASKAKSDPDEGSTAEVLAKVLRAIRDRGFIVADFAGVIGFSAEANKTYGTPYNPYTQAEKPTWGNFGQQIPWASLVQVATPPVRFSALGAGPTEPTAPAYNYALGIV